MELQVAAALFLLWNSIRDFWKREIVPASIPLFLGFFLFYQVFDPSGAQTDTARLLFTCALGLIPGIALWVFGRISKGSIGLGDGIVVMIVGIFVGLKLTIEMLLWAFCMAFIWSVLLVISKQYTRESRFPFVPFLFVGLLLGIWL